MDNWMRSFLLKKIIEKYISSSSPKTKFLYKLLDDTRNKKEFSV